jgi:hypothetical protein
VDNNKEGGVDFSTPPLHISRLRPYLGELNFILKDYGVCIVITCDEETNNVLMDENGRAEVSIGEPRVWFEL